MGFWANVWSGITSVGSIVAVGVGIVSTVVGAAVAIGANLTALYYGNSQQEAELQAAIAPFKQEISQLKKKNQDVQQLRKKKLQIQQQLEQKNKCITLEQFRKAKLQAQQQCLDRIKNFKFTDCLHKNGHQNDKFICVIGDTSAGKSFMLNTLFDLKLKTGKGTTTQAATLVHTTKNKNHQTIHIYDAPGTNEEFQFYQPRTLRLFHSLDLVIICFDNSVLNIKSLISVLCIINKKNVIIVRTKCNLQLDESYQMDFGETIRNDHKELNSIKENTVNKIYCMGDKENGFGKDQILKIIQNC